VATAILDLLIRRWSSSLRRKWKSSISVFQAWFETICISAASQACKLLTKDDECASRASTRLCPLLQRGFITIKRLQVCHVNRLLLPLRGHATIADYRCQRRPGASTAVSALLTLNKPTREMEREAASAGIYETGGMKVPKPQFVVLSLVIHSTLQFRQWEQEFPNQYANMIYKLYGLKRRDPRSFKHPKFFGWFTRKYIYHPLANSKGAIDLLDEVNPVVYAGGTRKYKLHQFLDEEIGVPALRQHLWQTIGIGNAARDKTDFERSFYRAFPEAIPKSGDPSQFDFFDKLKIYS